MGLRFSCFGILLVVGVSIPVRAEPPAAVSYARDIRPILADNCFACHGQDVQSRKAELRLDTEAGQRASDVVKPGKPDESELIARIFSTEETEQMPPTSSKKHLTDAQKLLLKRWVSEGARFESHWAFIAPIRLGVPEVRQADWVRSPIDRFVLANLESLGLKPSAQAPRETLIRRLSLDLTGLPPTPSEVDAFLKDSSADAYERLVDRLLASPRFGERLAQVWLDVARYADTNGYNNDEERVMWRWRDWVIEAFNKNQPYDQFLVEQLAGDLLPGATLDQKLATGFHRNHVLTTEGGIIEEEYRVEYVADRVQTTGAVFLGLSLQCARCHDHKYDPITQREYYQMFAFFNQSPDKVLGYNLGAPATPYLKAPTRAQQEIAAKLAGEQAKLKQRLVERDREIGPIVAAWEQQLGPDDPVRKSPLGLAMHFPLDETQGDAVQGTIEPSQRGKVIGKPQWTEGKRGGALACDGSTYVDAGQEGAFERTDPVSFSAWVYRTSDAAVTVLSKMHESNSYRGYDLIVEGGKTAVHIVHHWPDNGLKVIARTPFPMNEWRHLCVTYDGSSKAAGVKLYVDGQPQPLDIANDTLKDTIFTDRPFHIGRRGEGNGFQGKLDDVQFYRVTLSPEQVGRLARGEIVAGLQTILETPRDKRTAVQVALVQKYFLDVVDLPTQQMQAALAAVEQRRTDLEKTIPTALVMEDIPQPRTTHILERGRYDGLGEAVIPGVPASLPGLSKDLPVNRLGLAKWLADSSHPLTARVAVNRWWALLFGSGLVETEEDFGVQGSTPSHPELLDWLAVEYGQPGPQGLAWDTKALLRTIVTSATYRQASDVTAELYGRDPHNRLLARGPRYRMTAEQLRDNALSVSGLLVEHSGGPSVKPYQPPGLWEDVSVERRYKYEPAKGEGLYRRSLYTYWKRTSPPPGMTTFDAPDREFCVIRRARTNTPLQALLLLNDVTYIEASRKLAERVLAESPNNFDSRLMRAFRHVLARAPREHERAVLAEVFQAALEKFQRDPAAAERYLAVGDTTRDQLLNAPELAAWSSLASLLLNLDETLSKE